MPVFRYHHLKNLPEYFTNYFVTNNQIHQHNTRNTSKLFKCYKRTNYVKHTLSNKGVDVWNKLETNLKDTNFYNTFKKLIKQHLILNPVTNTKIQKSHFFYADNVCPCIVIVQNNTI
jgi:hypothetical protein